LQAAVLGGENLMVDHGILLCCARQAIKRLGKRRMRPSTETDIRPGVNRLMPKTNQSLRVGREECLLSR